MDTLLDLVQQAVARPTLYPVPCPSISHPIPSVYVNLHSNWQFKSAHKQRFCVMSAMTMKWRTRLDSYPVKYYLYMCRRVTLILKTVLSLYGNDNTLYRIIIMLAEIYAFIHTYNKENLTFLRAWTWHFDFEVSLTFLCSRYSII